MKALNDPSLRVLNEKRTLFVQQLKALLDKVVGEKRGLNADETGEHLRLKGEVDRMDALIESARMIPDEHQRSFGPGPWEHLSYSPGPQESRGFLPSGYNAEFRGIADFVAACRWPELRESREMVMGTGASGGFLVPETWASMIWAIDPETSIVRPRASMVPAGDHPDAKTHIPALDQSGSKGALGGLQTGWIAEGTLKPETDVDIREIELEPQEVACFITVTDKLLRNAPEAELFLSTAMRNGLFQAEDQAFLSGTGVGQPLGIINHAATIQVARAGAGAIAFADFAGMLASLHPDSLSNAIWLISQSAMAEVVTLVDGAGNLIFTGRDASKGLPATILGVPVRFTGRLPVLGSPADVLLADFRGYVVKQGTGPFVKASDGPLFTRNKTIIKAFYMVDGQPWLTSPLQLEDGVTETSFFVQLQ